MFSPTQPPSKEAQLQAKAVIAAALIAQIYPELSNAAHIIPSKVGRLTNEIYAELAKV